MRLFFVYIILVICTLHSFAQITLAEQDFDGTNTWTYITSPGGDGTFDFSNSIGVSGTNGMGYYYDSYLTGSNGSVSTVTFNTVNTSGYTSVTIRFRMAWGGTAFGSSGSGVGIDTDDYIEIQANRNGGAFGRVIYYNGYSNRQFAHNSTTKSLAYNANLSYRCNASGWINIGTWEITFPAGTNSVALRIQLKCNRVHENFYFDNFIVEGVNSLPVELTSFEAEEKENVVECTWQTSSETNSSHFVLLKGTQDWDFKELGRIEAAGNSNTTINYSFTDFDPQQGNNCYKLIQYDLDGSAYEKGIRCVNYYGTENQCNVYLADENSMNVENLPENGGMVIIFNAQGQILQQIEFAEGTSSIRINQTSEKGIQIVKIISENTQETHKIIAY